MTGDHQWGGKSKGRKFVPRLGKISWGWSVTRDRSGGFGTNSTHGSEDERGLRTGVIMSVERIEKNRHTEGTPQSEEKGNRRRWSSVRWGYHERGPVPVPSRKNWRHTPRRRRARLKENTLMGGKSRGMGAMSWEERTPRGAYEFQANQAC